ncbi:MAG: MogA/MoaB family molybdenum cofactor biosynthesis protein, partial [Clostridia bacterium]|nr:MogA/MoaB family molybdenum cofactor biosynthesis protein [Clostridia bacterium]
MSEQKIIKAAVLTMSDKGSKGEREDLSGPAIKDFVEPYGYEVVDYKVIPDDFDVIRKEIKRIADEDVANVIFTTGGTGFSQRDVTPEATKSVCHRDVPGIPEAMRAASMQITNKA